MWLMTYNPYSIGNPYFFFALPRAGQLLINLVLENESFS